MGKIFDAVVLLLYPVIVLLGLTYLGVRWTALILLGLVGRRFVALVVSDKATSRILLFQAATMAAIIAVSAASGSGLALRAVPFIISLTFIALFAVSLGTTPIIERFARLQRPDLPPAHVAYCRRLTGVWIAVLSLNSAILLVAAFIEDKTLWTIIVGPVSYGILGLVFVLEYPYRKWRFQDFNDTSMLDRLLRHILNRR